MTRFVLGLFVLGACAKPPSHELARAACDHQMELGYWKGFERKVVEAGHDAKDPALHARGETSLVEQKRSDAWKKDLDDCARLYEDVATSGQLECVKGAATSDAAEACLTAP